MKEQITTPEGYKLARDSDTGEPVFRAPHITESYLGKIGPRVCAMPQCEFPARDAVFILHKLPPKFCTMEKRPATLGDGYTVSGAVHAKPGIYVELAALKAALRLADTAGAWEPEENDVYEALRELCK